MIRSIFPFLALISLALPVRLSAEQPNIILCMADDMGWGDPAYNSNTVFLADGVTPHPDRGWITTPTLDAMAANGLRFDRFYAASAVCSPTRASCLTGRNPLRVGVPSANQGKLGFDETPLSEVLAAQGYKTGHFGKWHLGSLTTLRADSNRGGNAGVYSAPWHHQYDFCFVTESKVPTYHPYRVANNGAALPADFSDANFYGTRYWRIPFTWNFTSGEGDVVPAGEVNNASDGDDSKLIAEQAISFIQGAVGEGKKFFVVLWFHTPHKPVVDPDGVSGVNSSDACKDAIEDLDTALGNLRTELDVLGVRNDTMLWFTSDNGPENGVNSPNETDTGRSIRSGGHRERKRSLYEGGVRVPGILEWPAGIPAGRSTDFPAVTSDYYATIIDYLGVSVPGQKPLDGISLRPVIQGTATTRTSPIGFVFGGKKSWVTQQHKLIDTGGGWELFDLSADPHENTDIAAGHPELVSTLSAEFDAWRDSVESDTPFIPSAAPTVALGGPGSNVTGPFTVTATFSEAVTQLNANEFIVTNGAASGLAGGGDTYTVTITPATPGAVTVRLPEGSVIDADGNLNGASNAVVTTYTVVFGATVREITLENPSWQTVDIQDDVPGDDDNNVSKFSPAAPYATTLYARSTSSGNDDRKVRAFVKFDLSTLTKDAVVAASLSFNGFSLNDTNPLSAEVIAAGADWAASGPPLPAYHHATAGDPIDGGRIDTGLDGDRARDYLFDVTPMVRNWVSGAWENHGLQLRLSQDNVNNGLGVRTSGEGSIRLTVEQALMIVVSHALDTATGDFTIEWESVEHAAYRVEASDDLDGWDVVANVAGGDGGTTSYALTGDATGNIRRFYRVTHDF